MDIVVDFQAFRNNFNQYIIKECAVVDVDGSFVENWLVAPPYNFYNLSKAKRKESVWLTLNYHGLKWDDGGLCYSSFLDELRTLCKDAQNIFVKGKEKADYLQSILNRNVTDLERYNAPSLKELLKTSKIPLLRCYRHSKQKQYFCALTNVEKLKLWVVTNNHVFR